MIIRQINPTGYLHYKQIPNWFKVESIYEVQTPINRLGGLHFYEHKLENPYIKRYSMDDQDGPNHWIKGFDMNKWGLFVAYEHDQPVGGMALATEPHKVFPFSGFNPDQLAIIWDLRVRPENRRQGIGSALLDHAHNWALNHGFHWLGLETSNINVPACKLYASKGWQLGAVHRFGYARAPEIAHEVMLLWFLKLSNEVS